jgi:hypothetical protein
MHAQHANFMQTHASIMVTPTNTASQPTSKSLVHLPSASSSTLPLKSLSYSSTPCSFSFSSGAQSSSVPRPLAHSSSVHSNSSHDYSGNGHSSHGHSDNGHSDNGHSSHGLGQPRPRALEQNTVRTHATDLIFRNYVTQTHMNIHYAQPLCS